MEYPPRIREQRIDIAGEKITLDKLETRIRARSLEIALLHSSRIVVDKSVDACHRMTSSKK